MKAMLTVLLIAAGTCLAQDEPPPMVQVRGAVMTGQLGVPISAYVSTEMAIGGPTVKNAPFSAEISTERVQTLGDGNHIRNTTTGKMYRDTEGRVRREENLSLIGPWAEQGSAQTHTHVMINDPVSGTNWDLDQEHKIARKLVMPEKKGNGVGLSMGPQDVVLLKQKLAAAPGNGNVQTENLGTQMIEGVSAEGTRTTMTIPAGAMGNERPIQTVSERWYSPDLQTVVMSTVHDPRMGDSTWKLVNISRADQPLTLFEVPSDYQVSEGQGPIVFTGGGATK